MQDYWFRPRRYGYGATPTNWKGWAFICVFALAVTAIALTPVVIGLVSSAPMTIPELLVWLLASVVVIFVFVGVSRRKTDGDWRWRWGNEA
jgi:hypothetical protein